MSSLFSKNRLAVKDVVWMTDAAYCRAIAEWVADTGGSIIAWFINDRQVLLRELPETLHASIVLADDLTPDGVRDKKLLFAGHYPLQVKEAELCKKIELSKILVYSSMDSALFQRFGADKIKAMMVSMGMKNNESINHFMLTKAIEHIQEKIASKIVEEVPASSAEEWLDMNMPPQQMGNNK